MIDCAQDTLTHGGLPPHRWRTRRTEPDDGPLLDLLAGRPEADGVYQHDGTSMRDLPRLENFNGSDQTDRLAGFRA